MSKRECWLLKFDDGQIQVQLNKPESYSFYNQQTKESRKLIECVQVVDKSELTDLQKRFDELGNIAESLHHELDARNFQNPTASSVQALRGYQAFRATLGESK